ncbi:MAG: aldo/keto reductase [Candidatus Brocadiae bacterium]|nr:aldo/keto reductase [Candidatus Brocadiia bacterium]
MTTPPRVPVMIYGTAWKEQETERLVGLALAAGFRAIDTANQRRHYFEAGVGAALARAYRDGVVKREDLFLQTKFTDLGGQDQRLPYDPDADPATQVRQSFASSLEHLGTTTLDSYVLHGPTQRYGIGEKDRAIWRAMEELAQAGKTRVLGVSNVDRLQLEAFCQGAAVPPSFVQNRCFARAGWDRDVRAFCRERGIVYQGFSLLTANPHVVGHPEVARLAAARKLTPAQLTFAWTVGLGILPLTGTTDPTHMSQDLAAIALPLRPEETAVFEALSGR